MYKVTLFNGDEPTVIHYPNFSKTKLLGGQINKKISLADVFSFNIPFNNPGYGEIKEFQTLIHVLDTRKNKLEFEGRVSKRYGEMQSDGIVFETFDCEGEMVYLNDSCQRHGEYHNISIRDFMQIIIDNHNRDVAGSEIDKTFKLGIVDVENTTGELYRYLGYENTYETIKDKLLDRLGGELRVRKENGIRYLDYMKETGAIKHTKIELSKNLLTLSREVDPNRVFTRLVPLGERIPSDNPDDTDASEKRLTIASVNDGKDYIVDEVTERAIGDVIVKSEVWDDITQPSVLKNRGQQFAREHNRIKKSYQISALDLSLIGLDPDSFEVGNYYPVNNPIMGIDENLRVIGKSINILDPENSALEFGERLITPSQYLYESNREKKNIANLRSELTSQRKKVTNLSKDLSEATEHFQKEIEHMQTILDNADLENMQEVLLQINNQLGSLFDNVGEVGLEIVDIQEDINALNEFKLLQEQINHDQQLKNNEFEQRLLALENPEEGGNNG